MALTPQDDAEWLAVQTLLNDMRKQTTKAPLAPARGSATVTERGYRRELHAERATTTIAWCCGELIQQWEQDWAEWNNPGPWQRKTIRVWKRLPTLKDGQLVWPNSKLCHGAEPLAAADGSAAGRK